MKRNLKKRAALLILTASISALGTITVQAENYWWVNELREWGYTVGGENLRDGWYWIDGNRDGTAECYYFQLYNILIDTVTPDGYQVDGEGAWTVDEVVQTRRTDETVGAYKSSYAYDFGTKVNPDTPMGRIPLAENGRAYIKSVGRSEQRGWVQDENQKWRYFRDNGTFCCDEWTWIDRTCYCFDENGILYTDTVTPDGHQVNGDGQWTVGGVVQSRWK